MELNCGCQLRRPTPRRNLPALLTTTLPAAQPSAMQQSGSQSDSANASQGGHNLQEPTGAVAWGADLSYLWALFSLSALPSNDSAGGGAAGSGGMAAGCTGGFPSACPVNLSALPMVCQGVGIGGTLAAHVCGAIVDAEPQACWQR